MRKNLRKEAEELLSALKTTQDFKKHDFEKIIHELKVHQIELELQNEELIKAQEDIRESQQRYFEFFEMAPVGYLIMDEYTTISESNITASKIIDKNKNELPGLRLDKFIHPAYQDSFYLFFRSLLEKKGDSKHQSCLLINDNSVHIQVDGNCEIFHGKKSIRLTISDITKEKVALKELEEVKERLELSLMAGNVAWWVWDYPSQVVTYDKKKAEMLGYEDGVMTQNVYEISAMIHPEDYEITMNHMRDHLTGKIPQYQLEYRLKTKDGKYKWFYDHGKVTRRQDDGTPLKISGVVIDITERKNAEIKLQQLNKELDQRVKSEVEKNMQKDQLMSLQARQAAMGEMIGYIAHQWKQPLNTLNMIIYDIVESALDKELNDKDLKQSSETANGLIQHMAQTIDDFRSFFKPGKELTVFDVLTQIKKALNLVSATLKSSGIPVENAVKENMLVGGLPNEFAQVVVNLLTNARDAIADKKPQIPLIRIDSQVVDKKLFLRFFNNGGHIPEEIMEKIFKPYFSTKSDADGTGIGLYLSKIIIETNMKGELKAFNKDEGVEFEIVLPLVE